MSAHTKLSINLIAPCGMNCGLCLAYQRTKNHCPGCTGPDKGKSPSCIRCSIKNCQKLKKSKAKYCFKCEKYPCPRLKQLDKRYRTKYHMSMLENLAFIQGLGLKAFMAKERRKWKCLSCGGVLCVHREACLKCGKVWAWYL